MVCLVYMSHSVDPAARRCVRDLRGVKSHVSRHLHSAVFGFEKGNADNRLVLLCIVPLEAVWVPVDDTE